MKGIALNIIESYLLEDRGEEIWERVLKSSALDQEEPWVDFLNYDSDHYVRLCAAGAAQTGLSPDEFSQAVCRWCVPKLLTRHASFFEYFDNPVSLLAGMSELFPKIRELIQNSDGTRYEYCPLDAHSCVIRYQSTLKMCPGLDGLLQGLGDHFKVSVALEHPRCERHGDAACEVKLRVVERVCA